VDGVEGVGGADVRGRLEALWRTESARITAALARLVRDVGLAEELAQDALVAALEEWPVTGVPPNPGGWLMVTARHRAIDRLRRDDRLRENLRLLGDEAVRDQRAAAADGTAAFDAVLDEGLADDVLRLVFVACHPVLTTESQVALTLRVVGGLTTEEVARAFLVPEATVAQRIVRAKKTLAERRVPFAVPSAADRPARLAAVLGVLYLIFNEGHSATTGEEWVRPALCDDAIRLGGMLADLMPDEPEVHGLLALMLLQASRLPARVDAAGAPVALPVQDRGRWDRGQIARGFAALLRARRLGRPVGPYVLQAAIAACHAQARTAEETDWARIAALYGNLVRLTPTPVVELNRAVAVAMASGPAAGLAVVDALTDPALRDYHLLPAVRGDLLARLGRAAEARAEFARAAQLARNARERTALLERAAPGP
jgi:RNA polymerase sigma factor (sigma-70 family)